MTKTKQNTIRSHMGGRDYLGIKGIRGQFVSSGEMLGWQPICKFPLLVGSPSSQMMGTIKSPRSPFVPLVWKISSTFNVLLVLDQQGHSICTSELHLHVYQGLLFTGYGNYISYLWWACPPKAYTCFSQRELKTEYFRGLNTQYIKRYL